MTEPCDSLHAYVDGELDDAEHARFESHLATCKTCIAELPRLLELLAALDRAGDAARGARPEGARLTVIPGGRGGDPAADPAADPATPAHTARPTIVASDAAEARGAASPAPHASVDAATSPDPAAIAARVPIAGASSTDAAAIAARVSTTGDASTDIAATAAPVPATGEASTDAAPRVGDASTDSARIAARLRAVAAPSTDAATIAVAAPSAVGAIPPHAARKRRTRWIAGAGAAIAAAAALWLVVVRTPSAPPAPPSLAMLDAALGSSRPIEPRVTLPGADRFRPVDVQRSAAPGGAPLRLLDLGRELEQARDWHAAAVVALLAGDREHAARAFALAPPGPEVDADRAALGLLDGGHPALERSLEAVDRALAARPALPAALWNRALILAALDLPLAAAGEFDRVRALGEPGWSQDARQRADALRRTVAARRVRWKAAADAKRALIVDGAPVPDDAAAVTGYTTLVLYDAIRAAPSRAAVEALVPLAQRLDAAYRADHLTAYARRIAASDFAVRKPLADGYRRLLYGPAMSNAEVDGFLRKLERGGADDIRLGALVRVNRVGAQLETYRKLAAASGDPWFAAIAEQEAAVADLQRGNAAAAERRLRGAIEIAERERLTYRALTLREQLIKLYNSVHRLGESADQARISLHAAAAAGEGLSEANALNDLIAIETNRYATGLARAYLAEQIERAQTTPAIGPSPFSEDYDCATRQYAFQSLGYLALESFDTDTARAWLVRAPDCRTAHVAALALQRALFAAELYRVGHRDEDRRIARASLDALPLAELEPPARAFVELVEGNMLADEDREASRRHLRDAIARSDHRSDPRNLYVKARAYSFALLAASAGRVGEFPQVLELLAEDLGVARPQRCAVAIAHYAERTVMAYADARGAIDGRYTVDRTTRELDPAALVPAAAVDRLRGCERVAVLARAPVLGAARLLPPELAWSYVLGGPTEAAAPAGTATPTSSGAPRRLVVANPEAPPGLKLPPLGPYPDDMTQDATVLRGPAATPSGVLAAMRDASVIEFHTHGFIGNDVTEASYLALSPEPDRQYALTADDVAQVALTRSPLVILGACHAAASSRSLEGGIGLAEAFLRSGARAVIASPDAVQDLGAAALFAQVRDRVLRGVDPAIALRDERLRRLAQSHDDAWVSGLVVFVKAM